MNWRVPARTRARHAGHGGNAGGQVVGTILASGKLEAKDGAKAVIKTELQVAVIVGIVMTLCSAPALHVNFYAPPPVHLYEPVRTCTNLYEPECAAAQSVGGYSLPASGPSPLPPPLLSHWIYS